MLLWHLRMPQNNIVCFRGLRLFVALFDASVLLWSAFAGSQTGGWVLDFFFRLLGRDLLRGVFQRFWIQWGED
jgi:hypothetical protein